MRLLERCTTEHFAWLCRPDSLAENIYLVGGTPIEAVVIDAADVPWPVLLLLGGHSKKHIFHGGGPIQTGPIMRDVKAFLTKMQWASHFRDVSREEEYERPLFRRDPVPYEGDVSPFLTSFGMELNARVYVGVQRINAELKGNLWKYSNQPVFVNWARNWLKQRNLAVAPSDKDGVMCLLGKNTLSDLIEAQQRPEWYEPLSHLIVDREIRWMRERGERLCTRMRDFGWKVWARECSRQLHNPHGRPASRFSHTVKTHKGPGKISCRLLHASVQHALLGFSAIIDRVLTKELRKYSGFLAFSTADALRILSEVRVSESSVLIKVDIKDFYMSGRHDALCAAAWNWIHKEEERELLRSICSFVLEHQFVCDESATFRVRIGSGMGQRHSGALSDMAVAQLAEIGIVDDSQVRNALGIQAYVRYRDDILIVLEKPKAWKQVESLLASRISTCWKIEVEMASMVGVPFLDVYVSKRCDRLIWRPYTKPTARHLALSSTSFHPPAVHKCWPINEMQRLWNNSCDHSAFVVARREKIARWRSLFMHPVIVRKCEAWSARCRTATHKEARPGASRCVRLITRYHPAVRRVIRSALTDSWNAWERVLRGVLPSELRVDVAYCSGGRHLIQNLCTA